MKTIEWFADQTNELLIQWTEGKINSTTYGIEFLKLKHKAIQRERNMLYKFWVGGIDCTEEGGKDFEQFYNQYNDFPNL